MNESPHTNPVYVALEDKFTASASTTNPEPVFEISIDPVARKIHLEKTLGKGFLRFEATQAMYIQKGDNIKIGLWSIKNKKLLGTLTNQQGQWSTEDLQKIGEELKTVGVKFKEKQQVSRIATAKTNAFNNNGFEERIKDNADIGKVTLILTWVKIGLVCSAVVMVLAGILYVRSGGELSMNGLSNASYVVGLGWYLFWGVIFAELILYVLWATRVYTNLRRLGCEMKLSDQQVGWSFFVPIAWWIYPYLIVKEIWKKIQLKIKEVLPGQKVRGAAWINIWWLANVFFQLSLIYIWIRSRMISSAALRDFNFDYVQEAENLGYYIKIVGIIAFIFMFVFPIFFAQIIKQEKRLYRIVHKLKANSVSGETFQ